MQTLNYEEVLNFLKHYSTDSPPYDIAGVCCLLKAVLENLQKNFIIEDADDILEVLDDGDIDFLMKLLQNKNGS